MVDDTKFFEGIKDIDVEGFKELNDNLERFHDQTATIESDVQRLSQQFLGFSEKSGGLTREVLKNTEGLIDFGKALKDNISLENAMWGVTDKTIESTLALTKAQDQLTKAIGRTHGLDYKGYVNNLKAGTKAGLSLGATIEQVAGAQSALLGESFKFTELSKENKEAVLNQSVAMERLGVAAGDSAAMLDIAQMQMGLTTEEGMAMQRDLVAAARDIGVSSSKTMKQFIQFSGNFARYGSSAAAEFKKLMGVMKGTGIEMGNLIGFAEQFDTFDDAASRAGRLNAILGGQFINSLDMINMSYEERIQAVKEAIKMSGLEWEAMNMQERIALSKQLNMSMDDTQKLMRAQSDEIDSLASRAAEAQVDPEEFEDWAAATATFGEAMKALMQTFGTFFAKIGTPLLNLLTKAILGFVWLNEACFGLITALAAIAMPAKKVLDFFKSFTPGGAAGNAASGIKGVTSSLGGMTSAADDASKAAANLADDVADVAAKSCGSGWCSANRLVTESLDDVARSSTSAGDDVAKLGQKIGSAADDTVKWADDLARIADKWLPSFGKATTTAGDDAAKLASGIARGGSMFSSFGATLQGQFPTFIKWGKGLGNLINKIPGVSKGLSLVSSGIARVGDLINKIPGMDKIVNSVKSATEAFKALFQSGGRIADLAADITSRFSTVVDVFKSVGTHIKNAKSFMTGWLKTMPGLEKMQKVASAVGKPFKAMGDMVKWAFKPFKAFGSFLAKSKIGLKILSLAGAGAKTGGVFKAFAGTIGRFLYPLELAYHTVTSFISNMNLFGRASADAGSWMEKITGYVFAFLGAIGQAAGSATDSLIDLINMLLPKNWELPDLNLADTIHNALQAIDFGFIGETFAHMGTSIMDGMASVLPKRLAGWLGIGAAAREEEADKAEADAIAAAKARRAAREAKGEGPPPRAEATPMQFGGLVAKAGRALLHPGELIQNLPGGAMVTKSSKTEQLGAQMSELAAAIAALSAKVDGAAPGGGGGGKSPITLEVNGRELARAILGPGGVLEGYNGGGKI